MEYHLWAPVNIELDPLMYFMCHFHWLLKEKGGEEGVEEEGRDWDLLEWNHYLPVSPWTTNK